MSIIKLGNRYPPQEVLDFVKNKDPKSVLVMWIDDIGQIHLATDDSVTMQNFTYYNKSLDIWTHDVLLNG